jgi:Na+/melibiose symporter-like transporter
VIQSSNWLISSISSSVAGAIVLVSGVVLSLLYNTLTFAISAVLVFTVALAPALATPKAVGKPVAKPKMTREIVEGWRWLISSKGLFQLSISALFLNFFSTIFGAFVVVYVVLNLQGTALTYGIFLATMTLGGALGTLLVGRTSAVKNAGKVWILVYGVMGGGLLIVMGWTHLFWVAVPTVFVYSMGTAFAGNTWLTCAQTIVPENMRGRYFSLDGLLSYGVLPASQLAGGLLITLRGITFTVELAGLGLLVCGALSLLGRALWNLDGTVEPVPY